MGAVTHVCLSDLHLGALNSILTHVRADGASVQRTAAPAMEALGACLRSLRRPGAEAPQLVILGDLFELALTRTDVAATTFGHLVRALGPGEPDGAVGPVIRFVPGNHDHHLWSLARDQHFVDGVRRTTAGEAVHLPHHATRLLPAHDPLAVRDHFTEVLAAWAEPGMAVRVEQTYPNLGIVAPGGDRAVVLTHGHYVERLYRLMSVLDDVFGMGGDGPRAPAHIEADNHGWIDFFWSSLGDSGDAGRHVRALYESMQSRTALDAEVARIATAVGTRRGGGWLARAEGWLVGRALRRGVHAAVRERHRGEHVLSPDADRGLTEYLHGAVHAQLTQELGGVPREVAFVFGHTHKPFIAPREVAGFPAPVDVANTGGWVADGVVPEAVKGAVAVLVDDEARLAVLHLFAQGPTAGAYQARVVPPASGDTTFADDVAAGIDTGRDPWAALADAVAAAVTERGRQLQQRIDAGIASMSRPPLH